MKRVLSVLLIIISFSLVVSAQAAQKLSGTAYDFTLPSNSGKNVRLSELRGEVVMINFWASWCGPCRQEMPILEELYQRYSRAGFTILGVNVEPDSEDANKILKNVKISFPVLYDKESEVSELYNVEAMPSTVIIDRNGEMRYLHRGYKPGYEDDYKAQIKELIRE
ncbi:MAG: TlpA disulfide reductase family protein [Cellvibrionaceae bacterium]